MSYEEERFDTPASEQGAAASRVSAPSILLIIVGVLNLVTVCYAAFNLIVLLVTPADQLAAQQATMMKAFTGGKDLGQQANQDPQTAKSAGLIFDVVWLAFLLAAAIVPLIAGIRMRKLQGYGLAMTGSILALFPCVSLGCCLIIGPVAGIWSLVALSNAEVKAAFH